MKSPQPFRFKDTSSNFSSEKETKKEEMMEKSKNPLISSECIEILQYRIEQEELSSRLYESMSLWLDDHGFTGAAKAWKKDAQDEMTHAQWAKDFLLDLGIQPKLPTLQAPQYVFTGLPDIIYKSYDHEVMVTEQCNELASHAMKYSNHLLYQLAMKYLKEQQEEMGKVITYVDKLKSFGEDKLAMKLFDHEFSEG